MISKSLNYGWVMVLVVFILSGLAFGSLASISVFLKPISADFGWSRGATSLAYTVASFSSALFGNIDIFEFVDAPRMEALSSLSNCLFFKLSTFQTLKKCSQFQTFKLSIF